MAAAPSARLNPRLQIPQTANMEPPRFSSVHTAISSTPTPPTRASPPPPPAPGLYGMLALQQGCSLVACRVKAWTSLSDAIRPGPDGGEAAGQSTAGRGWLGDSLLQAQLLFTRPMSGRIATGRVIVEIGPRPPNKNNDSSCFMAKTTLGFNQWCGARNFL